MNASRRISQKRDENNMAEENERQSKKKRENILIDIFTSSILLMYLLGFIIYSAMTKSDNLGFTLAILSLIVTMCFEIYEWFYLFKKDKSKKHSLLPCMFSAFILMIFILLTLVPGIKITSCRWNDLICSGTLFLYIILVTFRKIIEDCKH